MQNPVIKEFRAIVAAHKKNMADNGGGSANDLYFKTHEIIKGRLRKFIDTHDFANLTNKDLLQLVYLVYSHQPMAFHSFAIKCEKQLYLATA